MSENSNWKTKTLILGGIAGLLIGLTAAFLFIKNQPEDTVPQNFTSNDGLKLGLGVVSMVKQVVDIGKS